MNISLGMILYAIASGEKAVNNGSSHGLRMVWNTMNFLEVFKGLLEYVFSYYYYIFPEPLFMEVVKIGWRKS